MLKRYLTPLLFTLFYLYGSIFAQTMIKFNTQWVHAKPEVLTYRTNGDQGNGFFQTVITKNDSSIEVLVHMMTPGFAKTLFGSMTHDMIPQFSSGKIFIDEQVQLKTDSRYEEGHLFVTTVVKPYNRILSKDTTFSGHIIDPSQIPFLARTLPLTKDEKFEFNSLNPQSNEIYPLVIKVVGEESVQNIECFKVEWKDFEGNVIYWIEKTGHHRTIKIEQPDKHRVTEIIL